MYTIEQLLNANQKELGAILAEARVRPQGDPNSRRAAIAQALGLKNAQLICGVGFNPTIADYPTAVHYLGFNSFEALASERNFQLIHDRYTELSVNNVLEIYAVLGRDATRRNAWSDLIITRLSTIEGQLEATINPILIGGYKLEIRGIYDNGLATEILLKNRLAREHQILRDIANETAVMLETNACDAARLLGEPGLSIEEKTKLVGQGLITATDAEAFIRDNGGEDTERLAAALAGEPH
ncbi:MAG: hypothetical protein AAF387_18775 [Pseudomonadota bacterium]